MSFAKFAPRLRARTIRKPKSLKHQGLGTFFEVESVFRVAGAGISTRCKIRGRRRSSWGLRKRWQAWWIWRGVSRGRRSDFVLCDVDIWSLRRRIRGRVANFISRMCYFAVIISRGNYRTSYASAQLFRGRCNTFEASNWKSLKCIVILRSSVWSTCHFWRKSRRKASFLSFNASFLKEVSQKCFVLELQSFIFEGSLAEMLGFWFSKLQFWRKSRKKASFLNFTASILKEVSQKSFVFELQSSICEGSLAESFFFGSFKASILKGILQKSFAFELQNFFFETSFADKLYFALQRFIFELQRFRNRLNLNLKSINNQINWISNQLITKIIWISNQMTTKIVWISDQMTTKSFDSQLVWIWHRTSHPNQSHIDHDRLHDRSRVSPDRALLQPKLATKIIWITHQLTSKLLESHIA